ncbi:MAG: DUF6051 family protein [Bacteroidota bacterium]|nr:DUF6051 family protein [Bacteroidota bacterium]
MDYLDRYNYFRKVYNEHEDQINIADSNLSLLNLNFKTKNNHVFYVKDKIKNHFVRKLFKRDSRIKENRAFRYPMIKHQNGKKSDSFIILLHGLNEKDWTKYFPWAFYMAEQTGRDVMLFPISFHMNRTPSAWKDPHLMSKISFIKKLISPQVQKDTFVNAALSLRLQLHPQRFFLSGIETIFNLLDLFKQIDENKHPYIAPGARYDLFAYSIGAFLTEILLMSDPEKRFSNCHAMLFCGGANYDRMHGVSKFIMDSEANNAITNFFLNNLDKELKKDRRLRKLINDTETGFYFKSLINSNKMVEERENRLKEISNRMAAVGLQKDSVMPAEACRLSLQGDKSDIPIQFLTLDFPFSYSHENPFPASEKIRSEVDSSFREVFDKASNFLQ